VSKRERQREGQKGQTLDEGAFLLLLLPVVIEVEGTPKGREEGGEEKKGR